MDESGLLCDDLALWEKTSSEGLKNMETIDFKMYLKIMLYYQYSDNDSDTIFMTYIQVNTEL
jgi:hypothetical protein